MAMSWNACAISRVPLSNNNARSLNGVTLSINHQQHSYEEGELLQPKFSGDGLISRFVSRLISIKPLFQLMKLGARQVFIGTAEAKGIPWTKISDELLACTQVYEEKELIEDKSITYPEYYLKEFHAYSEGNLSWKAASEAEAATMSMVRRAIPEAQSMEEALDVLRGNWLRAIESHHTRHSPLPISHVLDIGCSVGLSTLCLAHIFPTAQLTGLDLSPYFLAVARHRENIRITEENLSRKPIVWLHANGERTGLPSNSFDIVSLAYVIAITGLLQEAYRLLRPGGTIALTDNSPRSKVIQKLPPAIFTLMKATEPWMDEYYSMDLENEMREIGYLNVNSILTDPRHRTTTATVPLNK